MKVHCNIIQDLLPLYYDDICSEESKTLVEEHLEKCVTCRKELKLMDGAYQNFHTHLNDEDIIEAAATAWKKGKKQSFFRGSVVAAILILLLFLIFVVPYTKWGMKTLVTLWEEQLTNLADQRLSAEIGNRNPCFGYNIVTYSDAKCVFFEYQGGKYTGLYYSQNGTLIGFQGTAAEFERHGDGWLWKEESGDNWMYVEHVVGNWYWYEMHF